MRSRLTLLFALALFLRMAWIFLTPGFPIADSQWYWTAARTLFFDHAYAEAGRPTAYWPVGYPFFLSAFVPLGAWSLFAARAMQALASSLTVLLIHALSLQAGASRRTAWWAAAAFAFFPSAISLASLSMSETIFTLTLCVAFWAAFRPKGLSGLALAAMALSVSCYIRPVALILTPLLFGPKLSQGRPGAYLIRTLTLMLVLAATAWPWAARNYRIFGGLTAYSTNLGINLYIGHNDAARGVYVETPAMDSIERAYPNELERSRHFQAMAWAYAKSHPGREIGLAARKFLRSLLWDRQTIYMAFIAKEGGTYPKWSRILGISSNLYYWVGLALFLRIPWWRKPAARPYLLWLCAAFWVQVLFYCMFFTVDRYKAPGIPFLLAAIAAHGAVPRIPAAIRHALRTIFPRASNLRGWR